MASLVRIDAPRFGQTLTAWGHTGDLAAGAVAQYQVALSSGAWVRMRRRLVALADERENLLAIAVRYEVPGIFDGAHVRICVIGELAQDASDSGHTARLVDRLVEEATRDGFDLAMVHGSPRISLPDGLHRVQTTDLTLRVTESTRRGAPMAPVRSGERSDIALIAAIPPQRAASCRLHLERSAEYLDFLVTRRRLHAGLAPARRRQLLFLVVEEGMRPAAYVVISVVGATWVVEQFGDHDPSGARVGAILQTLIAREPAERRPVITAWLPDGIVPPQVTVTAAEPAKQQLWLRSLRGADLSTLSPRDVSFWHGDLEGTSWRTSPARPSCH